MTAVWRDHEGWVISWWGGGLGRLLVILKGSLSRALAVARGTVLQGPVDRNPSQNGSEMNSGCQDLSGDDLGTRTKLSWLTPGTPVGFPGICCPDLHSMFGSEPRSRKAVFIPHVTRHHNLWRKQKVRQSCCLC